jgi:hypothetical protein
MWLYPVALSQANPPSISLLARLLERSARGVVAKRRLQIKSRRFLH